MEAQKQPRPANLSQLMEPKVQPKKTQMAKAGEIIPVKVMIATNDGKLYGQPIRHVIRATKDFDLYEAMTDYHFQNPLQPIILNHVQPDVGAFNANSLHFRRWLIANGYAVADAEFKSDISVKMWSAEEIAEDNKMKALIANALAGGETVTLDANGDPIDTQAFIEEERANVGSIGHVERPEPPLGNLAQYAQ